MRMQLSSALTETDKHPHLSPHSFLLVLSCLKMCKTATCHVGKMFPLNVEALGKKSSPNAKPNQVSFPLFVLRIFLLNKQTKYCKTQSRQHPWGFQNIALWLMHITNFVEWRTVKSETKSVPGTISVFWYGMKFLVRSKVQNILWLDGFCLLLCMQCLNPQPTIACKQQFQSEFSRLKCAIGSPELASQQWFRWSSTS